MAVRIEDASLRDGDEAVIARQGNARSRASETQWRRRDGVVGIRRSGKHERGTLGGEDEVDSRRNESGATVKETHAKISNAQGFTLIIRSEKACYEYKGVEDTTVTS
ncbi:hypothetical protein E2542_SST02974 [Spatholobus suberectus]|nr:hypothetical protein E2542_SST02974 [Spatholobus suberectus]